MSKTKRTDQKDNEGDVKASPAQILAARIRHAREVFEKAHRKPYCGGWNMPSSEKVYAHLEEKFGMSQLELRYYFTYSRQCTHSWDTACSHCPVPAGK